MASLLFRMSQAKTETTSHGRERWVIRWKLKSCYSKMVVRMAHGVENSRSCPDPTPDSTIVVLSYVTLIVTLFSSFH
jgi:hypothetical protein